LAVSFIDDPPSQCDFCFFVPFLFTICAGWIRDKNETPFLIPSKDGSVYFYEGKTNDRPMASRLKNFEASPLSDK